MIYPIQNHQFCDVCLGVEDTISKALLPLDGKLGLSDNASATFSFNLTNDGYFEIQLATKQFSVEYAPDCIKRNLQNAIIRIQHDSISSFQVAYERYLTKLANCNYKSLYNNNLFNDDMIHIYFEYALYFREHCHYLWNLTLLGVTNSKHNTIIVSGLISDWGVVDLFTPNSAFQQ